MYLYDIINQDQDFKYSIYNRLIFKWDLPVEAKAKATRLEEIIDQCHRRAKEGTGIETETTKSITEEVHPKKSGEGRNEEAVVAVPEETEGITEI